MDSAFPGSRKQLRDRKPDLLVTFAAGRNDSKFDRVEADGEREMPKRVIDFDALWASDKLASCAEWAQSEYAWLYGLADASGSFEMTNLRVIWGRVAAIRKNLTLERLQEIFDEFTARGLLFTWEANGKRYGHWTGSDVPGRLPAPSWRMRLEKLAPPVPCAALAAYSARFGGSKEGIVARANRSADATEGGDATAVAASSASAVSAAQARGLKHELEEPQGQDWNLGLDGEKDLDWEKEKTVCPLLQYTQNRQTPGAPISDSFADRSLQMQPERCSAGLPPEELLEIYEQERGELPAAGAMTPERRRRCARWLVAGFTQEEFRAAVRRAAATPFLTGDNTRGWRASFDWLIANRRNVRKVLAGEYAPHDQARAAKSRAERGGLADLYAGTGPRPADCGVRVNPAALERIRAREARRARAGASARFTAALSKPAARGDSCGPASAGAYDASDAARACDGVPPQAARLSAGRAAALAAHRAPKTMAFDAQPRASPAKLK